MSVIPIQWEAVRSAADRATKDVATLLRSVVDGTGPVHGLDWNIGEVGAHLVTCATRYTDFARGASSSLDGRTIAQVNEALLDEYTPRDPHVVADDLERHSATFLAAITEDDSLMSMGGDGIDRSTAAAIWLGELRLHELDLCRTVGRRWTMPRDEALFVNYSGLALLPRFVNVDAAKGLNASFETRFRGGETATMTFEDGALTVTRGSAPRADCRMSADPLASLLVGYGRVSHWRVGLTGKIVVWGKKPWLAFRFNRLLTRE